jgi:pentatricopeptide repeat protein
MPLQYCASASNSISTLISRSLPPFAKDPKNDVIRHASSATLCSAFLIVALFVDAFFGDRLWASLSSTSVDTAQQEVVGSKSWCLEWAFCIWLILVFAWGLLKVYWTRQNPEMLLDPSLGKLRHRQSNHALSARSDGSGCKEKTTKSSADAVSPSQQWRTAIEQAARDGKPEFARMLFEDMERSGVQPDAILPNVVMRAYAKKADLAGAEQWLSEMQTKKMEISPCTYNIIINAFAKAGKVDACDFWMTRMTQAGVLPNAVTFTTVISAYAHRGCEKKAEAMLTRMTADGVHPDAVCFNALIHACSVSGNFAGVERWVDAMEQSGLQPSVTTFTAAIDACAKMGEVSRAEGWMDRLSSAGLQPNVISFSALMDACAKAGMPERAGFWYDQMLKVGVTPNSHSFSSAISACARAGDAAAAEQWLARAQAVGLASDPVLYSGVIDACGKANDADRAWSIFEQMRSRGVVPHVVLYAALARPFAHRGNFEKVEEIAKLMDTSGVATNEYFLYAQLLAYGNARPKQCARAEHAFRKALSQGLHINDHVASALGRAVGRPRAAQLQREATDGSHGSLHGREATLRPSVSSAPWRRRA